MAQYYLDEDLTTGLNDGSSWANAWQSWSAAMSGIGTLTENSGLYIRSSGLVDESRSLLGITIDSYTLTVVGDNNCTLKSTTAYQAALTLTSGSPRTGNITVENITTTFSTNGYGFRALSEVGCVLVNCVSNGNGVGRRGVYVDFATADISLYNCIGVGTVTAGIGVTSTGMVNAYNCYFESGGDDYSNTGGGTLNLTTCASSDATGSAGLQSVPYDNTTFTETNLGSEDFHLVSGSDLIGSGTVTVYTEDKDGDTWGSPRDIGVYTYSTAITPIEPDDIVLSSLVMSSPSITEQGNSQTFSYSQLIAGFSGYFNFVDDPTLRKFGKNASWFGTITGTDASLKCGATGTTPYVIYVDGVQSTPVLSSGEIELFSSLSDIAHTVCIIAKTSTAPANNYIDTAETEVLTVTGSAPAIENIPFDYVSNPSFVGRSSYSTGERPDSRLTPTYEEVTPWSYERGQVVFKAQADEIWLYTDNETCLYSIDGGSINEVTFSETNKESGITVRRAVQLGDSFDNTTEHEYRIWGDGDETYGVQGVALLTSGSPVSLVSPEEQRSVMFLGASVVQGSAGDNQGYTDTWLVGNAITAVMTKAGNAGHSAPESEADFPSIIEANGLPDFVVFGSSTNDSGSDPDLQNKYESLINAILAEGVESVICRGIVPYYQAQHDALEAAVTAIGNPNVHFISSQTWTTIDTIDGTHPTVLGYQQLTAYEDTPMDDIVNAPIVYSLSGTTYDKTGAILGSVQVSLFKHSGSGVYSYIGTTLSDPTSGEYSFTPPDNDAAYMVVFHKDDTPNVFDVSDNNLEPVEV